MLMVLFSLSMLEVVAHAQVLGKEMMCKYCTCLGFFWGKYVFCRSFIFNGINSLLRPLYNLDQLREVCVWSLRVKGVWCLCGIKRKLCDMTNAFLFYTQIKKRREPGNLTPTQSGNLPSLCYSFLFLRNRSYSSTSALCSQMSRS